MGMIDHISKKPIAHVSLPCLLITRYRTLNRSACTDARASITERSSIAFIRGLKDPMQIDEGIVLSRTIDSIPCEQKLSVAKRSGCFTSHARSVSNSHQIRVKGTGSCSSTTITTPLRDFINARLNGAVSGELPSSPPTSC